MKYSDLIQFATPRQIEYIEAVEKYGSQDKAAKALNVNARTLKRSLESLRIKAAQQGHSPAHDMTHTVPDGFKVRGVSTYYDQEGKPRGQWVKSSADDVRRHAAMQEAYAAMADDLPRVGAVAKPRGTSADLATVYTLTDSHVGALCWGAETMSGDWDLSIAEATLTGCFARMVESSPDAKTGIVAQLGDFLHSDGSSALSPVTPTSGHVLDQDGRFSKVVGVAVRILRRVIDMALKKHERVIVLLAEGNHDISSSVWLRTMFAAMYEREPRVTIIDQALPYYAVQHGKTMLCWHHGHLHKNDKLPILFASQFPQMWGTTAKRYAHTGHRHHVEEKEHSGMTVIQHSTLAARDAYAARGGWMSERQATAITYHAQYGEVGRVVVTPEMCR